MTRELTFTASPLIIAMAISAFVAIALIAMYGWYKSGFDRGTGLTEVLRVLIGALAAITLCQPEWKETYEPEEKPVLAVLVDETESMATQDVLDADPDILVVMPCGFDLQRTYQEASSLTERESIRLSR